MPLSVPPGAQIEDVAPHPGVKFSVAHQSGAPLFQGGGPNLEDIAQGSIADCFFLSSLIAILHRPTGKAFIDGMMVEEEGGKVTVRLYEDGQPVYLRTERCRVTSLETKTVVSKRATIWPDVLEACASVFTMKSKEAHVRRTPTPTLDNLHLGSPTYALTVLTNGSGCKAIPDERPLDINKNNAFGFLECVFNRAVAPDKDYRDECVTKAFGAMSSRWDQWAQANSSVWKDYITSYAALREKTDVGITVKTNTFETFLRLGKVPLEFHAGLRKLDMDTPFLQGRRNEPKFTDNQDQFFMHIQQLVHDGHAVVLASREKVGRGIGKSELGEEQYKGMLGGHCYAVEGTTVDAAGMKRINITNPWGHYVRAYEPDGRPIEALNTPEGAGRFSITLHELGKKFEYYAYSETKFL